MNKTWTSGPWNLLVDLSNYGPGACFLKVPKSFRTRKAIPKSQTLWLQSCFIHIFLIWTEGPFHTRSFGRKHLSGFRFRLTKKIALRAGKVFEMSILPYVAKMWSDLANWMIIYFSEILRKKLHYPGILWFAPFVVVPAAMFPAPSTITIPETKQHINFNRPYHGFRRHLDGWEKQSVRNYSVCMGIRWQITLSKIKFYAICESKR